MNQPQLWVIAGPNGAGKSTLSDKYLKGRLSIVNPDEIAKQLNPTSGRDISAAALKAGRLAIQQQNDLLKKKTSFAVETTLTGKRELKLMEDAKSQSYKVNLLFVGVRSPNASQSRVTARVQSGGHDVPAADVARRYPRSLANLDKALQLSDRAFVLDNSFARPRLLLSLEKGSVKFKSPHMPEWAVKATASIRGVDESQIEEAQNAGVPQGADDHSVKPGLYKNKADDFKRLSRKDLLEKYPNDQAIQDATTISGIAAKFAKDKMSSETDRFRFLEKVKFRVADNLEHGRPNKAPNILEERSQDKDDQLER